jgi:hypothetical protein
MPPLPLCSSAADDRAIYLTDEEERAIELMMDWDKGQMVTVSETIDDTLLGDIQLKNCKYDPDPGTMIPIRGPRNSLLE